MQIDDQRIDFSGNVCLGGYLLLNQWFVRVERRKSSKTAKFDTGNELPGVGLTDGINWVERW
jgi:hypothetical protein